MSELQQTIEANYRLKAERDQALADLSRLLDAVDGLNLYVNENPNRAEVDSREMQAVFGLATEIRERGKA